MDDKVPQLEIDSVSKDWYDYNRQNYDYDQLELMYENFKRAPPISIAQYKARTSEKCPPGIFDENEQHGMMERRKNEPYNYLLLDRSSNKAPQQDSKVNIGHGLQTSVLSESKTPKPSKKNIDVKIEPVTNYSSNKSDSQKKKKKKFKQLDFNNLSSQPTTRWTQPWNPDFSKKFENDTEFPAL